MNKSKKIKHLFEKKLDFINNENFELPQEAYTSNKWSINSFQNQKEELNRTKSLLNDFNLEEWSRHTKHRDPSSFIIRFVKQKFKAELVTQAWCKFYECLSNFSLISKEAVSQGQFSSVHLCEAPGAFISALNHYLISQDLNLEWKWLANSLNPDFEGNSLQEMIPDDRLLRYTYHNWYFGTDCTGDITKYHNYLGILEQIPEKVWLVTADGSIDCSSDPGNQESFVEYLHYCETLTALSILRKGGNLVLKMFTVFEDSSICLLYLLTTTFQKVSVFKPASSKSGNSEVYIICLSFKGFEFLEKLWPSIILPYKNGQFNKNKSMFDLPKINKDFITQLLKISDYFMKKQIERINDNIFYFRKDSRNESSKIHQLKIYVANKFIHKYRLKTIQPNYRLVETCDVSEFLTNFRKINFVNRFVKINVNDLISQQTNDFLDIKIGLAITEVKSSRFCTKENLEKYKFWQKPKSFLYENIEKIISGTTTVINFENYNCQTQGSFQKYIFYEIFNSNICNLVFIKFPLVTNFLVGLIFLLFSCYEHVYLHKSGFLLLHDFSGKNLKRVKNIYEKIDSVYRSENCKFGYDIFQVVSPNLFCNNNFFEFIWNYNNIIFSKFLQ